MSNRMLGIDSATLCELWRGPLADLVEKLLGKKGLKVREELTKFLREDPCWVKKASAQRQGRKDLEYPIFDLSGYKFTPVSMLGSDKRDWVVIHEGAYDAPAEINELNLYRVRLVPGPGFRRAAVVERGGLREERGYKLLGFASFVACWSNRNLLPVFWYAHDLQIYFDGFALQQPYPHGAEAFDYQWCVCMFVEGGEWRFRVERIHGSQRCGQHSCSAVYV